MRIRQILINLLSNASRFTDLGGITVEASSDGRQVTVTVSDTGLGIRPEDLRHVFDEFRQFGESRRGGSGLGLSICKRLIELHGGNMWVESVIGQGSTFFFSLPLVEAIAIVPESPSLQRNLAAIANRPTQPILAVIDRDGVTKVIERYLDRYHVERVANVDQATRLMAAGRASALLFCSSEDAESWKQVPCDEPSVHPIAYCPLRKATQVPQDLGAAGYLVKPVTTAQLNAALRRLGRRWRTVGIVEDQAEMADLMSQMILRIRPTAQTWRAADGRAALQGLRERRPDVLLLDLLLPHLNGYELLHDMRRDERLRGVPVVIITGAEDRDERIVADMVGITRSGGMTVGEAMACLKRGLDSLLIRTGNTDRES
jgi:CheY-like chemotaxis protein